MANLVKRLSSPNSYGKGASAPEGNWQALVRKQVRDLFPGLSECMTGLAKASQSVSSQVTLCTGDQGHPFDFDAANRFKVANVYHGVCIDAKTQALVGLGHEDDKLHETLDPLCRVSWQALLTQLGEDYNQVGNCGFEVVRETEDPTSPIAGIHWHPASRVRIYVEDATGSDYHFIIAGEREVRMAAYGDLAGFRQRMGSQLSGQARVSEFVHIPRPSALSRWYGWPSWLSATPLVELVQAMIQGQFDLHSNRGVPEFLFLLLGSRLDKKTWAGITSTMDGYVGIGNQHKASAINIPDPNITAQVERLALEAMGNGTFWRDMTESLNSTILSAHRVPPVIAGIVLSGKMGATNETTQAILAFQLLTIGPDQRHFATMLAKTIGQEIGKPKRDDWKFQNIVADMGEMMKALQPVDTAARMREEVPQAAAEGRKLSDGLKD